MKTVEKPIGTPEQAPANADLTDEQIRDTFERLQLTDPSVRQYYAWLSSLEEPDAPTRLWLGTHSGTKF